MNQLKQMETLLWQMAAFELAVGLAATIVFFFVLYLTIKAAIRDGIRESGLTSTWTRVAAQKRETAAAGLPDMRAER